MALQSISPVSFESVSQVTATNSVELGTRRTEGLLDYVYVYNGGAEQISHGEGGYLSPASMLSGMTVSVSNAASQSGHERFVGVAHNATITTGAYGWLAVRGPALIALDASEVSMNSGVKLAPGVDGGFVARAESVDTGVTAVLDFIGVTINSCVTTVGTGKAFIKSPLFS